MKKDYSELNCCAICKNVFKYIEYDNPYSYYCTLGTKERPKCGSVALAEYFGAPLEYNNRKNEKVQMREVKKWDKWSAKNEVRAWGICSDFSPKG